MSEEQLKAFITKVQADASLQEQLKAEGADVVGIAKTAGFLITIDDLNSHSAELSDEELEGVSGGGGEPPACEPCATWSGPLGQTYWQYKTS